MTLQNALKSSASSAVLSNFIIRQAQERMWRGLPKDWPLETPGPLEPAPAIDWDARLWETLGVITSDE